MQLSEHLDHVFHFIPDIETHEDGSELLSRHGDTIARQRIDLDDLHLLRFILRAQNKFRKIGVALQVVDDNPTSQVSAEAPLLVRQLRLDYARIIRGAQSETHQSQRVDTTNAGCGHGSAFSHVFHFDLPIQGRSPISSL